MSLTFTLQQKKTSSIRVKFVDEKAIDVGGVSREMFSAFFEEAYVKLFDGLSTVVPIDFPNFSSSPLPILGTVISHAYIVAGILPVKIAYPSLCGMLLRNAICLPDEVLIQAFVESLNCHEAGILKSASSAVKSGLDVFPEEMLSGLINIVQ